MSRLLSRLNLQNPIWQGIGAIVAIIALLVSVFMGYDIYQKSVDFTDLTIEKRHSFNPIDFGGDANGRVAISIDGEIVSDIKVYDYIISNTGRTPIVPSDYIEPIKVCVGQSFKLLAVEDGGAYPSDISTTWNRIDNTNFQLKPLLLNPGDSFRTLIFVSRSPSRTASSGITSTTTRTSPNSTQTAASRRTFRSLDPSEPNWTARIVNVPDLNFTTPEMRIENERRKLGSFYFVFYYEGWSIYALAVLISVLYLFGLFVGVQFGVLRKVSGLYCLFLYLLMGLSIVSGEVITSRLRGFVGHHWFSKLSLVLYLLLIFLFAFPAIKNLFQRKSSSGRNTP